LRLIKRGSLAIAAPSELVANLWPQRQP
jgi:hypothetical protein